MENLIIFVVVVIVITLVVLYNKGKKREMVVGKGDYEYTPTEEKIDEGLNEPAGRE